MKVTGEKRALSRARMALASVALLTLGGCASGMPDLHSITSLSAFGDSRSPKPKADKPVTAADLIIPGALDDMAVGKANAPVTVVEYVSLNCASCNGFQNGVFPKLKKGYIDKGKVRLIVREFPEDDASTTAALALRCVGVKDYFKAMDKLVSHQKEWGGPEAKKDALYNLVKFAGLKRDKFDACLADQSTSQGLASAKARAQGFGVTVTPTFFVNGKKVAGAISSEEMQGFVEGALAETEAPAAAAAQPSQPSAVKPKAAG
jgi:protein-disulfide isomerase